MVTVDGPGNRRPGPLDGKDTLLSVALDEGSGGGVEEDGLDSEEGKGRGSRLRLGCSGKGTVQHERQ